MPANVVSQARSGKARQGSRSRAAWESVKSLAGAVVIYLVVNTFLIAAYRIPSGSMIPTLLIGDWLFVNRVVYGPHIPFTDSHLPSISEPKRGEVIVFESPHQADEAAAGNDPTPTLVKRMVGMAGDTLFMRDGVLFVNGVQQRPAYAAASRPTATSSQPTESSDLFAWQHAIAVQGSRFGPPPAMPQHDNWGPLVVPPERYFMMGDNRYESKDSRYWGVVPRENVRGRPSFVYYSYRADDSDRPLPFITDIRWGRIGASIR